VTARVVPDPSGTWLAVVGPAGALLVAHASDRAEELLAALSGGDPVQPVLDVLAGSGVSVAPDFALVLTDDAGRPRHAVIRGSAVVRVVGSGDVVDELTGRGARTWMEHELDAAAASLAAPVAAPGPALPLERGAVLGARVDLTTDAPAPAPAPEPEPVADPRPAPAAPAPAAAVDEHTMVEPDEGGLGYDRLFEATIVRPVEAAAVRPEPVDEDADASAPAVPAPAAPPSLGAGPAAGSAGPEDDGDHDGETVLSGALPGRDPRTRPTVDEIAPAAAAHRYALVLPDGRREPLAGELVVGRAPTARVVDGRMPRLVTIEGDPDVSRSHVRVALEGDTVVVTDLRSRNGTSVVLPGKSPQLLRADEPTPVIPGTVIDLGESKLRVERDGAGEGA
jgi:hypothetical protein